MFDKEYSFRGKHAEMVKMLTAKFDENNNKLFERNVDVYRMAPIVGFLYGRKSEIDKDNSITPTKIFTDALMKEERELKFAYILITLLSDKKEKTIENRIDQVFRFYETEKAKDDEENFEKYVLGGVEIIYEKLIEKSGDYLKNLYDFMEEFDNRYRNVTTDEIIESAQKKNN